MGYFHILLVTDESTLTLESAADALRKLFAPFPLIEVTSSRKEERPWDNNPGVSVHDREQEEHWTITVSRSEEAMDPDQRAEILENVAPHPDYQQIASCRNWFYIDSLDDDDLEYLDIYARTVETLEEFPGVYVFDRDLKLFSRE